MTAIAVTNAVSTADRWLLSLLTIPTMTAKSVASKRMSR